MLGDAVKGAVTTRVSARVLAGLSSTETPQGVVAVVHSPVLELEHLNKPLELVVLLAQVRDPGNAGTLLRSSAAAGASAVVFIHGAVDPLNPKTVRAASGALFAVPVARAASLKEVVPVLRHEGVSILGASAQATDSVYDLQAAGPLALVLGNEAWGIPKEDRALLDGEVGIPMAGEAESLNVAVAGSILMFEIARRQKRLSGRVPEGSGLSFAGS